MGRKGAGERAKGSRIAQVKSDKSINSESLLSATRIVAWRRNSRVRLKESCVDRKFGVLGGREIIMIRSGGLKTCQQNSVLRRKRKE